MDYWPISSLQISYKAVAKVPATRLQISGYQRPLIGLCLSTQNNTNSHNDDANLSIALEQWCRQQKVIVYAVGIQKAFNTVDRNYLYEALLQLLLYVRFIDLIRRIYTDATASFVVNGSHSTPLRNSERVPASTSFVFVSSALQSDTNLCQLQKSVRAVRSDSSLLRVRR